METVGDGTESGKRPGGNQSGGPARPGRSGEGAVSALEHLLQQQRRRDAQEPLPDGGGDGPPAAQRP